MTRYLTAGNVLRNGTDLEALTSTSPEVRQAAFDAFDELSPTFLKPIYDRIGGNLTYDELRILRLLYLVSQPATATS